VLEPVVEQVQAAGEAALGFAAGGVAILADDHRRFQAAGDQQRFVAELRRQTPGIDHRHAARTAPVSARKHIEGDPARLEKFAQHDYERRLARAANRQVSNAHHRPVQAACR
jgi:hypothetical protein